jgi:hypothetical protein
MVIARFAAVIVFPSPGPGLLTRITRGVELAEENWMLVRMPR